MATDSEPAFAEWCILELMGHRRLSGRVTEKVIAGQSFVRLDVPAIDGAPAVTQFYHPNSVYCMTPVTEQIAMGLAANARPQPVSRYDFQRGGEFLPGIDDE